MKNKSFNVSSSNFGAKGWLMIFYTFIIFFMNTMVGNSWQIAGEFWAPKFGWDSAALISASSYGQIISVFTGLVIGRLMIKKVDAKIFSIVAGIITIVSVGLVSYAPNQGVAILLVTIASLAVTNWAYGIGPVFLASWFPRKKGLAMGWATIGIPLGAGLSSIIINAIASASGIEMGMWTISIIGLVAVILSFVFVTTDPMKRNYNPDNDQTMTTADTQRMVAEEAAIAAKSPWNLKRVLTTREMYCLAIPIGMEMLMASGSMMTLIPRLMSKGFALDVAIKMILAAALVACPMSFLMGFVDSKIGPKKANLIVIVVAICSAAFMMSDSKGAWILAIISLGTVVGGAANFATSVTVEYWGKSNFTRVFSILSPLSVLVGGLGPAFTTGIAAAAATDMGPNYNAVSIGFIIMLVIGLIMFASVGKDFVAKKEAQFAKEDN